MTPIPVYTFTGFLESGKTKFIQETLEDERFNDGEQILLIVCEEGNEVYDIHACPHQNIDVQTIDSYDDVTTEKLLAMQKRCGAERIILELNGMQTVGAFYEKMPATWQIAQEVMFADASTIMSYNTNLRSLVVDKLTGCEMVVFNRMEKGRDIMPLHKLARALNRGVDIVYDYTDGSTEFDEIEDPLPFDINAPLIALEDDDYALWYRDISEEPEKYAGKSVRFKAQVARLRRVKDGWFAPGRFVMTCCAEDITFMGLPCEYKASKDLATRGWVMVTAKVAFKHHASYQGKGPILTAISVEQAVPAEQEVCTF